MLFQEISRIEDSTRETGIWGNSPSRVRDSPLRKLETKAKLSYREEVFKVCIESKTFDTVF